MIKERWATVFGIFTSILAGSCCIGPVLFLVFGITGLGFLSKMGVFRPYLIAMTFILVGVAYHYAYGKGSNCETDGKYNPETRRINRILFWVLIAFAVFGVSFPYVAAVSYKKGWLQSPFIGE